MDDVLRTYLTEIGRKGGQAKSPAKTAAARRNIAQRWKDRPQPAKPPRKRKKTVLWPATTVSSKANPAAPRSVKVGRNEPCPCQSGRKFKRCCGAGA